MNPPPPARTPRRCCGSWSRTTWPSRRRSGRGCCSRRRCWPPATRPGQRSCWGRSRRSPTATRCCSPGARRSRCTPARCAPWAGPARRCPTRASRSPWPARTCAATPSHCANWPAAWWPPAPPERPAASRPRRWSSRTGRSRRASAPPATCCSPRWTGRRRRRISARCRRSDQPSGRGWAYFRIVDQPATSLPPPMIPGLTGLSVVARGGYATVYRATQESVGREVAVKVENRTLESERDQRRFLREARASGRMSSHPHVVDLFDAGMTPDGHPYLIMELCDGSYADRIRSTPLTAIEVRDVGTKIADALADAHALGVLHRDVKPANILVSRFGEPALADFGLAVLAESRETSITLEVLTPAYAPREMFRTGTPPSPAADVYSLCATLYALLRGRPPRWRDERNPSLITLMELFDRPIPDLPGVPAVLLDVLRTGMLNEPGARPTAAMLRDRLAALALPTAPAPGPAQGTTTVGAVPVRAGGAPPDAVTPTASLLLPPPSSAPSVRSGPAHPVVNQPRPVSPPPVGPPSVGRARVPRPREE